MFHATPPEVPAVRHSRLFDLLQQEELAEKISRRINAAAGDVDEIPAFLQHAAEKLALPLTAGRVSFRRRSAAKPRSDHEFFRAVRP